MMNSTLFPLASEPQSPDPDRTEPTIWLKRLVILSSLDSSAEIRNIPFRRGLNVIQTKKMKNRGGPVSGHSVGKTLLMRLIRYSLGEAHFGSDDTEAKILSLSKSLVVVTHWSLAGQNWIVVRPLHDRDGKLSFASKQSHWQPVVDRKREETQHQSFVLAVNKTVLSELPDFKLLQERSANWIDLLPWLSRDYQCGYRSANDWRHPDANSGSSLQREDNSLLMQWAMGLMSEDEIDLRAKHRQLLKQRSNQKAIFAGQRKRLEMLWPSLREKLKVSTDTEVEAEQKTFNSFRPADYVHDCVKKIEQRKASEGQKSTLSDLQESLETIRAKLSDCHAEISSCDKLIKFIEKQIEELNTSDHVADWKQQRADQASQLEIHQTAQSQLAAELEAAKLALQTERDRVGGVFSGIDEEIGRWKGFLDDAESFQNLSDSMAESAKLLSKAESSIENSLQLQDSLRAKKRSEIILISEVYQQLLQKIFGDQAEGAIKVDGHGLYPNPGDQLAPAGAALSVMTTVLAFDIAALSASIRGIGQHPRFVMHDSPREGDMEAPLFARLFEVVHELEQEFEDPKAVSFQYIVTTTTSPPDPLGAKPFVVQTLDARKDKGLLLKRRF